MAFQRFYRPELIETNIGGAQRDGNTAEHIAMMAGRTDIENYLREQAESVSTALSQSLFGHIFVTSTDFV